MLIAIPTEAPGGLDAEISEHFGHCAAFTLVTVEDGRPHDVTVVANPGHDESGCLGPVSLLQQHNVDVLLSGGMGMRPLAGFQEAGIAVHFKEAARSVREAVELFVAGRCRAFGEAETCGGCGGHEHEHGHDEEIVREPIEGRADVRDNRVVTLGFQLRNKAGRVLDSSERSGPIRYLHGRGQLMEKLEGAVAGLEAGAGVTVEVSPEEGFGVRDESRVIDVPRGQLPADARVGALVVGQDPQGRRLHMTVVHLDDTIARLDGNHPLAGRDLVFELHVLAVESATPEELARGHVH
jgi:FKBP-type peptidyl-prolyl cis-trans isomerase 2/predicted Fe-Mo cluster-binding NifX family protein